MNVDIQKVPRYRKVQCRERIFMLHHKCLIGILDCLCDDLAFYISSINKIVFKIAVASGDHRLSDKSLQPAKCSFCFYRKQIGRNIPSINTINNILQVMIA